MAADLAISGSVLRDGRFADAVVVVTDGRIAAVEPAGTHVDAAEQVRLADDAVLLPGLVDTHVHVNEPGRTEWEGFATATRAAAAGGVTTLVDMPLNSIPPTVDPDALAVKRRAARGQCHVDVGFWGGAVPASLGRLRDLADEGVFGFKCFLVDSGVPEFPPLDHDQLDRALAEVAAFDGLMVVHAEDPGVLADAPAGGGPSYAAFVGSRPHRAEDVAISRLLDLARRHDARVHVLHLASADALPLLAKARADGVRVTVETCPHYLTVSAEEVPDGHTEFKCCPPIRDAANRDALWRALVDGVVDCVVSDHSPSTVDLKRLDTGDFGEAWGGVASLQLGLPLMWTAARERGIGLERVVSWMSAGPAALAGLRHVGAIAPGLQADLVAFAPEASFVVDPQRLHHRNPVTPYAGRRLSGVVRDVWLRGNRILSGRSRRAPSRGPPAQEGVPMTGFTHLPDLASRDLAGSVCAANDEFFAARENLIRPEPPAAVHAFGHKGKEYDGWETRRRREPGSDWAIVRLGVPGVVHGVVVDTSYFTGNFPPHVSVEGAVVTGYPSPGGARLVRVGAAGAEVPGARRRPQRVRRVRPPRLDARAADDPPRRGCRAVPRARDPRPGPALPHRHDRPRRARERRGPGRLLRRVLRVGGAADPARAGAAHGGGLGERPASRRRQRLGAVPPRRPRRGPPRRAGHVVLPRQRAGLGPARRLPGLLRRRPRPRPSGSTWCRGCARSPTPGTASWSPRTARSPTCGSTSTPTAGWRGCGSGASWSERTRSRGRAWCARDSTLMSTVR